MKYIIAWDYGGIGQIVILRRKKEESKNLTNKSQTLRFRNIQNKPNQTKTVTYLINGHIVYKFHMNKRNGPYI